MGSDAALEREVSKENYFNPRSRMGSDISEQEKSLTQLEFQSTLPHGERHDPYKNEKEYAGISIHAPAWGATAKT